MKAGQVHFGDRDFTHGPAGHVERVERGGNVINFGPDDASRMGEARRTDDTGLTEFAATTFTYDGRSYLLESTEADTGASARPLYSSEGLLHTLTRRASSSDPETTYHLFHFAGRPVAQLVSGASADTWWYLTMDHLGTPVVATDGLGVEVWAGPLEPFGRDPQAGLPTGALESGVFLRFPGQWEDETWQDATMGAEVYYNVHRWYQQGTGRYTRPDPLGLHGDPHPYPYALGAPLSFFDLLGLKVRVCCKPIPATVHASLFINTRYGANTEYKRHCYFEFGDNSTLGLHGPAYVLGVLGSIGCQAQGEIQRRKLGEPGFDQRTDLPTTCGPWSECADDCVNDATEQYPSPSRYCLFGPNSNTFAGSIERQCPVKPPPASELRNAPGWYDGPPG